MISANVRIYDVFQKPYHNSTKLIVLLI